MRFLSLLSSSVSGSEVGLQAQPQGERQQERRIRPSIRLPAPKVCSWTAALAPVYVKSTGGRLGRQDEELFGIYFFRRDLVCAGSH
eukprot:scaffold54351_cov111-Phaeocystis_antarctica.AAC.1